jgi:hypothetical protein
MVVGLHQHTVNDAEDGGVRADPERERDGRDAREAWRSAEQADGVADVLNGIAHGVLPFQGGFPKACRIDRETNRFLGQPPPRGPSATCLDEAPVLFLEIAEHPLALGRREEASCDPQKEPISAVHHSVLSRRSSPAVIPVYAR